MNKLFTTDEIKQLVSIEQVLFMLGIKADTKRIPCPIHNGTDKNFSIQGDKYYCYVCGATGDIFSLVQSLNKCDFKEAKAIICDTFHLQENKRTIKQYKEHCAKKKEEKSYQQDVKFLHNFQYNRICQTLQALKGTPAEPLLMQILTKFRNNSDFILYYDILAMLTNLLYKYGVYKP